MEFRLEAPDDNTLVGVHEARIDDLKQVADHCAAMRAMGMTGTKDAKVVATVPSFFIHEYCNRNGVTFAEFMRDDVHINRFLSDPALSAFRIWEGKV